MICPSTISPTMFSYLKSKIMILSRQIHQRYNPSQTWFIGTKHS
jgi:hypothetical protein